ncbi:hypothetical protein [Acidisphaera sp. L21]|uniref:hypothetical protein n=1 Tax=Acidisphaera sp. L21 TaxID=1641851 RepID=UPI00131B201A|nr:hypothetical protein [Acidisphaera sp. L21]
MRRLLPIAVIMVAFGAQARPVTLTLGKTTLPTTLYGPADMLCDLHKCRLFNLPASVTPIRNTIVEFGLPDMSGQDGVEFRRCFALCRASVLGYESNPTSKAEQSNPTLFITPIELRLE